jgi:hypothetical protein
MKDDTQGTLKVQYQNNEAQDTNKNEAIKKNPGGADHPPASSAEVTNE